MNVPLACAVLASLVAFAPAATAADADEPPATGRRSEPRVQHTVIEDDGARIEELRVRGQTQRISVTPKGGPIRKPYEIIPADGARDLAPDVQGTRGAAGQRVWHVLSF
ncbi:MAG TPA: DUF2782 domain-containing protein [Albitalea sp.]